MNNSEVNYRRLEVLIVELQQLIFEHTGDDPFTQLEKARRIVSQRNYQQFGAVKKKLINTIIRFYNQRVNEELNKKITEIEDIISLKE